ncbi:hypothetical protein DET60_102210 [Raoultella planticola]|nr:hypothetical protein DFO76_103472 [Raoultella planticola]TDX39837.1 hypothetical protein DET60_102210 [Raoultella planticola]
MAILHQSIEEQFEVSAPGRFSNAQRFEYLRIFQSRVATPAATRTLLKNGKPLQLRFFLIQNLATPTAAAFVLYVPLPIARFADYPYLLTNNFHLFPVRWRYPLCELDPLRGLSVRIGHLVGEYLSVNEPGSAATTACHLAGRAQRVITENVFCQNTQKCSPLLVVHSLKRPDTVGPLSG